MSAYPRYTPAQRKYLSSLDPRDPDYLGPDDDEEDEDTMEDNEEEPDDYDYNYDYRIDERADDYRSDNPADDYIMTERELRGEL